MESIGCRIGFGQPKPPVEALPVSVDNCSSEAFNETSAYLNERKGALPVSLTLQIK